MYDGDDSCEEKYAVGSLYGVETQAYCAPHLDPSDLILPLLHSVTVRKISKRTAHLHIIIKLQVRYVFESARHKKTRL